MIKLTLIFLFLTIPVLSQSENDTREFIRDVFEENYLEILTPSYILFSNNLLKIDASAISGRNLTNDEFENLIIYAFELEVGVTESEIITFSESIDLRDMRKISTIKQDDGNYIVSIYLHQKLPASRRVNKSWTGETNIIRELDRMKIQLGPNKDAATKIKNAFIHLGKLRGIDVIDGDLF